MQLILDNNSKNHSITVQNCPKYNRQSAINVNLSLQQSNDIWTQIKNSYSIKGPQQSQPRKEDVYVFGFQDAEQSILLKQPTRSEGQDDPVQHFLEPTLYDIFNPSLIKQTNQQKFGIKMTSSQIQVQNVVYEPMQQYKDNPQKLIALFYDQIFNDYVGRSQLIEKQNQEPIIDTLEHFIPAEQNQKQIENVSEILSSIQKSPKATKNNFISQNYEIKASRKRKCSDYHQKQINLKNSELESRVSFLQAKLKEYEVKVCSPIKKQYNPITKQSLKLEACPDSIDQYCQTPQKKQSKTKINRNLSNEEDSQSEAKTIYKEKTDSIIKVKRKHQEAIITKTIDITINQPVFKKENSYLQQIQKLNDTVKQLKRQNSKLKNQVQQHKKYYSSLSHYGQKDVSATKFKSSRRHRKFGTIYKISQQNKKSTKSSNPSLKQIKSSQSIENEVQTPIKAYFQSNDMNFQIKKIQLPKMPNHQHTQEELAQLAEQTFRYFGIKINQQTIKVQKYSNCVLMTLNPNNNILWFFNGKFYYGGWEELQQGGHKQGQGYECVPSKFIYQGSFKNGKRNGFGIMENLTTGSVYKGFWVDGLKEGYGKQKQGSQLYEGLWKKGKKQGKGKLYKITANKIQSNCFFQGYFENNLKNGQGIQRFETGDFYQGEFLNGKFHGKGHYQWKSGAIYIGQFLNGKREGIGKWTSENGETYEGNYKNNMKEGYGVYKWKDGTIFQGIFIKDKHTNSGKLSINRNKQLLNSRSHIKNINMKQSDNKFSSFRIPKGNSFKEEDQEKGNQSMPLPRRIRESKMQQTLTYF